MSQKQDFVSNPPSGRRSPQLQMMLVASPRNHLIRGLRPWTPYTVTRSRLRPLAPFLVASCTLGGRLHTFARRRVARTVFRCIARIGQSAGHLTFIQWLRSRTPYIITRSGLRPWLRSCDALRFARAPGVTVRPGRSWASANPDAVRPDTSIVSAVRGAMVRTWNVGRMSSLGSNVIRPAPIMNGAVAEQVQFSYETRCRRDLARGADVAFEGESGTGEIIGCQPRSARWRRRGGFSGLLERRQSLQSGARSCSCQAPGGHRSPVDAHALRR